MFGLHPQSTGLAMAAMNEDFGELLIEALEEAVAYKQGKHPGARVTRYEVTSKEATHPDMTADHGRAS
jgi:hypothetical protein